MEQSITDVTSDLASTLGIGSDIIILIVAMASVLVMTLFIYLRTANMLFSTAFMNFGIIMMASFGFIPLWIIPISLIITALAYYRWINHSEVVITEDYQPYGDKLKLAYEAKFGYRNPEFDKEIDQHIKVVENLGKGYTRTIHLNKLKRLAKFVEAK